MNTNHKKPIHIGLALSPIILLIILLAFNISIWSDDAIGGPNQVALILATVMAGAIAAYYKVKFKKMRRMMVKSISDSMPSILILLLIGALSGTWMLSGVVPTLIYYGLDLLNPKIFLLASLLVASVVSLATGSSWSTIATVGVALMGVGQALGFSPGIVAGAIISGAYFGDKMSPLSDTTNLAPAMAGTDIFTHIRYMTITTVPTYILTILIFLVLGFFHHSSMDVNQIASFQQALAQNFNISLWLLWVPVILIVIIVMKKPPLVALFIGAMLGAIAALLFQSDLIVAIDGSQHGFLEASYRIIMQSFFGAMPYPSVGPQLKELISTGGMEGMLPTIWLIITAMAFSGMMESAGLLIRIAEGIVSFAKSTGSLVASTVASSIFMNITASEQYISIVVPGRMYAKIYKKKGLKPELLSRSLEDGGTVTSVLVPWNTGGAVNSTVLHTSTLSYLPYAFFNLISPLMSIFIASIGYKIRKYTPEEMQDFEESNS